MGTLRSAYWEPMPKYERDVNHGFLFDCPFLQYLLRQCIVSTTIPIKVARFNISLYWREKSGSRSMRTDCHTTLMIIMECFRIETVLSDDDLV